MTEWTGNPARVQYRQADIDTKAANYMLILVSTTAYCTSTYSC